MKTPYDVITPIENLFAQIDDAIEFADIGNSGFTNIQIITTAYLMIFQTGQLEKACEEWDSKAIIDKIWANFKINFCAAHQRFCNQ